MKKLKENRGVTKSAKNQQAPSGAAQTPCQTFAEVLQPHVDSLLSVLHSRTSQIETFHARFRPGQKGLGQDILSIAKVLVLAHDQPVEILLAAQLSLAKDSCFAGAFGFALTLTHEVLDRLAESPASSQLNPRLEINAQKIQYIACVGLDYEPEKHWKQLIHDGIEFSEDSPKDSAMIFLARIQQLTRENRQQEALKLIQRPEVKSVPEKLKGPLAAKIMLAIADAEVAAQPLEEVATGVLSQLDLAFDEAVKGDLQGDIDDLKLVLSIQNSKSTLLEKLGEEHLEAAASVYATTSDLLVRFFWPIIDPSNHPLFFHYMSQRSRFLEANDLPDAIEARRLQKKYETMYFGGTNPLVAYSFSKIADLLKREGKLAEAKHNFLAASKIYKDIGDSKYSIANKNLAEAITLPE